VYGDFSLLYIHKNFIEKHIHYIDFETYLSDGLLIDIKAWQRPKRSENLSLIPGANSVSLWTQCRIRFLEPNVQQLVKGRARDFFLKDKAVWPTFGSSGALPSLRKTSSIA
jgi:hypothetical protein